MVETYKLPEFLTGRIEKPTYVKWLARKASTHAKRDRSRLGRTISVQSYKQAIHNAVETSKGVDWYTGEILEWEKISSYDNALAKKHRSNYKASLALLPTVDHVLNSEGNYDFVICSWRTNDSKNDLSLAEFISLCKKVIHSRQ